MSAILFRLQCVEGDGRDYIFEHKFIQSVYVQCWFREQLSERSAVVNVADMYTSALPVFREE